MIKIKCVLFDMDGVMIDTESQYDIFWKQAGEKYNLGISGFEKIIKGTTLPNILKKYFSHLDTHELEKLIENLEDFETRMSFMEIDGALAFVNHLKDEGYKVGLVTSSNNSKLANVYKVQPFDKLFDTIVSAERVTEGKPNPQCFLLAADDLGVSPCECLVFEDSFAGIEAAKNAGMPVIALATTHNEELLKSKTKKVIPHFIGITSDILI